MTTQIKYLAFKGIEKKEQILFKSFLNLAKNELEYQVVILKAGHVDDPDILILDESYNFDDSEKAFQTRPTILIGDDLKNDSDTYICRPVQWSDFKLALSQLNVQVVDGFIDEVEADTKTDDEAEVSASTDTDASEDAEAAKQILPNKIEFQIDEISLTTSKDASNSSSDADPKEYEYDLGDMSVDYNSFTNSDYLHDVVDDVRGFNKDERKPPVLLRTDEESSSVSSVLIFETDAREVWDISLSEESSVTVIDPIEQIVGADDEEIDEVVLEQKVGLQLQANEKYWLSDNEIIVDHQSLFYVKAERGMVYSAKEPGLWPQVLREGTISKLPMVGKWQPKKGLKAYPIACIHWVNAIANDIEELSEGLDEKTAYILNKWPQFDLIELDNSLLKLCTMLFVRAETIESLMTKSGYSRATIIGLINACHSIDIIRAANDFDQENSITLLKTDGVLGKIKGVFK